MTEMEALEHVAHCMNMRCAVPNCQRYKSVIVHCTKIQNRGRHADMLENVKRLCATHASACTQRRCGVPGCKFDHDLPEWADERHGYLRKQVTEEMCGDMKDPRCIRTVERIEEVVYCLSDSLEAYMDRGTRVRKFQFGRALLAIHNFI